MKWQLGLLLHFSSRFVRKVVPSTTRAQIKTTNGLFCANKNKKSIQNVNIGKHKIRKIHLSWDAMAWIKAGVVPQHPPNRVAPQSTMCRIASENSSGVIL